MAIDSSKLTDAAAILLALRSDVQSAQDAEHLHDMTRTPEPGHPYEERVQTLGALVRLLTEGVTAIRSARQTADQLDRINARIRDWEEAAATAPETPPTEA